MTPSSTDWPIFVISLTDAQARRTAITQQMAALSLEFTYIDAVDGRTGLSPRHEAMVDRPGTLARLGRPMGNAEYACALSHMSIYQHIIDTGLDGAIVLEDDAIIGPLFPSFLQVRGYEAAPMVQMDHLHGDIWRFGRKHRLTPDIQLTKAARSTSLASCYSVSRKAAAYILHNGLPLRGVPDWPCDITPLPVLLSLPRLIHQAPPPNEGSALEPDRATAVSSQARQNRALRFFKASYWRRWVFKRLTKRIS